MISGSISLRYFPLAFHGGRQGSVPYSPEQGLTKFFAAYKQIYFIGLVPTKFTINSTTNWGLCLQAALACLPTLSGPGCRAFKRA